MRPDRRPRGRLVAWSRHCGEHVTLYRLFRRDMTNAVHVETLTVLADEDRCIVAQALRVVRRRLKARVDEIDLAMMETMA